MNYTHPLILWSSHQNLTQFFLLFFQPFIWMEDAAEGNSVVAARCQQFGKVPGMKHAPTEEKDEPNIETRSMDWHINSPCSAKQLHSIVICCTETKGQTWHNAEVVHLITVSLLHTRRIFSSWVLFLLILPFSLPPLFLNFFSSTCHSMALLSICNLVCFLTTAKPEIYRIDQCLNSIVDTDVSI